MLLLWLSKDASRVCVCVCYTATYNLGLGESCNEHDELRYCAHGLQCIPCDRGREYRCARCEFPKVIQIDEQRFVYFIMNNVCKNKLIIDWFIDWRIDWLTD